MRFAEKRVTVGVQNTDCLYLVAAFCFGKVSLAGSTPALRTITN